MILLNGVSKTFETIDGTPVEALRDVSFEVRRGEFVSVVGPSGCGKTTLLKIMVGLIKPSRGQVLVEEYAVDGRYGWAGYMSQMDTLLPWRTVLENAEIGLEIRGVPKDRRRQIVQDLIAKVGLRGFEDKYPFEISGGMRKRLSMVRILSYGPDALFLDEPFGALDVQTRDFLQLDLLKLWEETKKTIIFVTHDITEAIALSDRILLMTFRPGTIKKEYVVSLPRPRPIFEIHFLPGFDQLYKAIWDELKDEVVKAREEIFWEKGEGGTGG